MIISGDDDGVYRIGPSSACEWLIGFRFNSREPATVGEPFRWSPGAREWRMRRLYILESRLPFLHLQMDPKNGIIEQQQQITRSDSIPFGYTKSRVTIICLYAIGMFEWDGENKKDGTHTYTNGLGPPFESTSSLSFKTAFNYFIISL